MLGKYSSQQNADDEENSGSLLPLVFVPVTGNEGSRGRGETAQVVRAHVTRLRHAKAAQNLRPTFRPYNSRIVPVLKKAKNDTSGSGSTKHSKEENAASTSEDSSGTDTPLSSLSARNSTSEKSSSNERSPVLVPRLPSGTQQEDPFWTYPVDYEVSLSPIFAHYIQNIAVVIPDLDGPAQELGVLRRRWFPLAMTDPATMYAVLLMAASHYHTVRPQDAPVDRMDLVRLKDRALFEINTAIADPSRAISDATIGAVMKMAAYEAIFGDSSSYAAHMRGLSLMVRMRGGLDKLGLNGLLERMVAWIDLNAAHLTGLSRFVGGEDLPTAVGFDGPSPFYFAGIS